ncbi:hypothetical protein OE903_23240 [Bacillus sp. B6(2022)]|nr:hypothetical protein [Bacillus sp. B6(2022)]
MKTYTLFCIENLIEVIQEKRALKMDISTLNLQTTENIKLDEKLVQFMRKAWEDELNLFFVHVNTYGFIYTNPFSNFKNLQWKPLALV